MKILQLKREDAIRDWRKHHNEEIHNLYSSPNIFQVITTRIRR